MSIARDISRQSSKQTATLTASQTAVTVTGGFSGSNIDVYLNGARIVQGQDYSLNGTSGIVLTQGASAGDIIEFVIRNTSNSGFSAADTGQIVDGAVTFDKLSNSATLTSNVQKRIAAAWVNFQGNVNPAVIRDDFNISSVTYQSTGLYFVNFDRSMANTNYCFVTFGRDPNDDSTVVNNIGAMANDNKSVSSFTVRFTYSGSYYNSPEINVIVFGELS